MAQPQEHQHYHHHHQEQQQQQQQVLLEDLSSIVDAAFLLALACAVCLVQQRRLAVSTLAHALSALFFLVVAGHYIELHVLGIEGVENLVRRHPGRRGFADWSTAGIVAVISIMALVCRFWACKGFGIDCVVGEAAPFHYACRMHRLRFYAPVFATTVASVFLSLDLRLNALLGGSALHPRDEGYAAAIAGSPALLAVLCLTGSASVWLYSVLKEAETSSLAPLESKDGARLFSCRRGTHPLSPPTGDYINDFGEIPWPMSVESARLARVAMPIRETHGMRMAPGLREVVSATEAPCGRSPFYEARPQVGKKSGHGPANGGRPAPGDLAAGSTWPALTFLRDGKCAEGHHQAAAAGGSGAGGTQTSSSDNKVRKAWAPLQDRRGADGAAVLASPPARGTGGRARESSMASRKVTFEDSLCEGESSFGFPLGAGRAPGFPARGGGGNGERSSGASLTSVSAACSTAAGERSSGATGDAEEDGNRGGASAPSRGWASGTQLARAGTVRAWARRRRAPAVNGWASSTPSSDGGIAGQYCGAGDDGSSSNSSGGGASSRLQQRRRRGFGSLTRGPGGSHTAPTGTVLTTARVAQASKPRVASSAASSSGGFAPHAVHVGHGSCASRPRPPLAGRCRQRPRSATCMPRTEPRSGFTAFGNSADSSGGGSSSSGRSSTINGNSSVAECSSGDEFVGSFRAEELHHPGRNVWRPGDGARIPSAYSAGGLRRRRQRRR